MEFLRLFAAGCAIGMANVIPGVSGGTLAVVFNIYDRFINAITYNVKALWNNKGFILPLAAGMAAGILIFSKLITILYSNFPMQTNYFFTGLIAGSLPMLYGFMTKKQECPEGEEAEKFSAAKIASIVICALAGFALILTFAFLQGSVNEAPQLSTELPEVTAKLVLLCFLGGFAGAVAMVIPGISGSLIMLILGIYPVIMMSIPAFFIPQTTIHACLLLIPVAAGVLCGLISGAKLVSFLLKKAPNQTYGVIFGLIAGSAVTVFPGVKGMTAVSFVVYIILFIAGAAAAYFSSKLSPQKSSEN